MEHFQPLGLNSALLTGLKFFTITWKISTPGLKCYTFPPLEVKKKRVAAENMKHIAMFVGFFSIWGVNNLDITVYYAPFCFL